MYARTFLEIGLSDRPSVGGKGASLGELTRAGIRVPPGFVVTTAAFERFIAWMDAKASIRKTIAALDPTDLTAISVAADQIRERIESAGLPTDLREQIVAAYRKLTADSSAGNARQPCPVAVRSSATSEDSAEASFAGLQDTYLWVRDEDQVLRSVLACWASLYSTESVSYRLRLKLPESNVAMGVVIQLMVSSRCSGVMFTRSPTTGDRSVIAIEGSWGLGSCIVSGEVTPDKFVVNKVTGEICGRTVSQKVFQHVPRPDSGGVKVESVPAERQSVPCLSDADIAELAQLAKRVEKHYGAPQDIEWAIGPGLPAGAGAADQHIAVSAQPEAIGQAPPPVHAAQGNSLYILQSRPETVWASREAQPVAAPKPRAFDHVLALLSGRTRTRQDR